MIFCAVFRPSPLTVFSTSACPVATIVQTSSAVNEERIIRAVLPPTPETPINDRKISRSARLKKAVKHLRVLTHRKMGIQFHLCPGTDLRKSLQRDIQKYPTPAASTTTDAGVSVSIRPVMYSYIIRYHIYLQK